jgi:DNA-binding CsgD family transcriptional regulator
LTQAAEWLRLRAEQALPEFGAEMKSVNGFALTPIEERILKLRASGLSRKEIAELLNRSPRSISNALTIAKEKLGARSLIEAAVILIGADLLSRA